MAYIPIPRSPVPFGKSGRIDSPDGYAQKMQRWREATKQEALDELHAWAEYAEVGRYIDAIEGRWWGGRRPGYRSKFSDNELAKARKDARTMYTDVRPAISVRSCQGAPYAQTANIIRDVILSEWRTRGMDMGLVDTVDHGLFGCGYAKLGAVSGALTYTACGADSVLPVKCSGEIQSSAAVLYKGWRPLQYYHKIWREASQGLEKYGRASATLQDNSTYRRPGYYTEYSWNTMSPAMKRLMRNRRPPVPAGETPFPMIEFQEFWVEDNTINESTETITIKDPRFSKSQHNYWYEVKPGELMYPRKRLMVFAGDRLMYDGPSPYWHGLYPFEQLLLDPIVWGSRGLSKFRNLLPFNFAINEVGAGVIDTVRKALNQTVISQKGAFADEDWNRFFPDIPGQKLRTQGANWQPSNAIRYVDPPPMPQYVTDFLTRYLIPTFEKHAGTIDANAIMGKRQLPSGDSLDALRDSQGGHFRLEGRLIEMFLARCANHGVSNVLQYFNSKQRMARLGPDGSTLEDFDYNPSTMVPAEEQRESFWKKFSAEVAPGSMHGANREKHQNKAIVLYARRAIGTAELLKAVDWPDIDRTIKERDEEFARLNIPPVPQDGTRTPRLTVSQQHGSPA